MIPLIVISPLRRILPSSVADPAVEWKLIWGCCSASKNSAAVVTDFDSKLLTLSSSDPKTILDAVQKNLQATLK